MRLLLTQEGSFILQQTPFLDVLKNPNRSTWQGIRNHVKYAVYKTPMGLILNHSKRVGFIVPESWQAFEVWNYKRENPQLSIEVVIDTPNLGGK